MALRDWFSTRAIRAEFAATEARQHPAPSSYVDRMEAATAALNAADQMLSTNISISGLSGALSTATMVPSSGTAGSSRSVPWNGDRWDRAATVPRAGTTEGIVGPGTVYPAPSQDPDAVRTWLRAQTLHDAIEFCDDPEMFAGSPRGGHDEAARHRFRSVNYPTGSHWASTEGWRNHDQASDNPMGEMLTTSSFVWPTAIQAAAFPDLLAAGLWRIKLGRKKHIGLWQPTLHVDGFGRAHREDGPAIYWPDSAAYFLWHGTEVPEDVILRPGRIRWKAIINERNAEVRRAMLERVGFGQFVRECGRLVQQDECGTLYELKDRERIRRERSPSVVRIVEVINSTPERDGSLKKYWLRVAATCQTAREGVAWSFGLRPEEYHPMQEA